MDKKYLICLKGVRCIQKENRLLFLDFQLKLEFWLFSYLYLSSNNMADINIIKNNPNYKIISDNAIKVPLEYYGKLTIVNKLKKVDYDYRFKKNVSMIKNQHLLEFKEVYILPYHIIFIFNNYLIVLPNYYEKIPNDEDLFAFSSYIISAINKSNFSEYFKL